MKQARFTNDWCKLWGKKESIKSNRCRRCSIRHVGLTLSRLTIRKHEDFLCVRNFESDIIICNHYTCLQIPAYSIISLWDLMALKKDWMVWLQSWFYCHRLHKPSYCCVLIVQQDVCSRLKSLRTKGKLPSCKFVIIKKEDSQTNQPRQVALWSEKWHCLSFPLHTLCAYYARAALIPQQYNCVTRIDSS